MADSAETDCVTGIGSCMAPEKRPTPAHSEHKVAVESGTAKDASYNGSAAHRSTQLKGGSCKQVEACEHVRACSGLRGGAREVRLQCDARRCRAASWTLRDTARIQYL
eukprot:2050938-Pleurochrysis_carterae.AAC.1